MNKLLLQEEIQDYIEANLNLKASDLALKKSPFKDVSSKELAQQLLGKQKAKNKLPTWFQSSRVYYPLSLNIEQTSSEKTADYKANLVGGELLIDCTGGFGIDCVSFSKKVNQVVHCELNEHLQQIAKYNFSALGFKNITSKCCDGVQFALTQKKVDWIYIDPSRRNEAKGKVFFLKDCLPDVTTIIDKLLQSSENILIKTAPILDLSVGIEELKYVAEIHIVSVNNEVKELLWVLNQSPKRRIRIITSNISKYEKSSLSFFWGEEEEVIAKYTAPKKYLYEPFSTLMKAGIFNWISRYYKIGKLHQHTHLYTSDNLIDFEGKAFEIIQVHLYNKKEMKSFIKVKANVVTRNFKLSVAEIRKQYKIQEGLERYLFFVTNSNNKPIVIDCKKISL